MLSRRHISLIRSFLILMSLLLLAYQPGNCLDVNISQVDANNFPFIYSTVTVDTSGMGVPDLTQGNFVVTEDGRVQTDLFDVEPPTQGSGVRLVDFVFLIDNSGSMCDKIDSVRNNVNAFANSLASQGYDYRLGAVRFGQGSGSGNPQIFNNGNLTGDLSTFHSWINAMYCNGYREPGLQAVIDAATSFNFRPGSQRHFLLITDEDSDGGSLSTAINVCLANNIVVHVAVICHSGSSYNQYCRPNTSISGATGGRVFSVVGPYNSILDDLGEVIGNTYVV
ncbi:MAG: VWA domain-containing protein, partial [candidate division Zixibacteria bacterium]|nr:VWA domain-containing protein [candidate division Zixibacteria bacterium]